MKWLRAYSALSLILFSCALHADEGFWRADALPLADIQQQYQATPSPALIETLQLASLRLSNGCSASFVSANGLLLTNRHCVRDCLAQLSGVNSNLLLDGLSSDTAEHEQSCPALIADQFLSSQDITRDLASTELTETQMRAQLIEACRQSQKDVHCEIHQRPEREQTVLMRYRRYRDVRLAFAPEAAVSRHRGIKDFPRYTLDFALLRIWQADAPLKPDHYLPLQADGPQADELLLMAGFPAASDRLQSPAEWQTLIETVIPHQIAAIHNRKLAWSRLAQTSPTPTIAQHLKQLERQEQNLRIQLALLSQDELAQGLLNHVKRLQKAVKKNKSAQAQSRKYWSNIDDLEALYRQRYIEYRLVEQLDGFQSERYQMARDLVRAAVESHKPDAQRLPEFREAALPRMFQRLFAAPIGEQATEVASFSQSLDWLQQTLGPEHPIAILSLADRSPQQRATDLIQHSQIDDAAYRRKLWEQGRTAIEASDDRLIKLARQLEPFTRDVRTRFEAIALQRAELKAALARGLWQVSPSLSYPAASHDWRISFGQLQGWTDGARHILATTSFAGMLTQLDSDTALPAAGWTTALNEFELNTPVNFVSNHDAVLGHSGSPVVNLSGELVGLVYDTNSYGLAGQALYDEKLNRAVSVHPLIIRESLRRVYDQSRLAKELFPSS